MYDPLISVAQRVAKTLTLFLKQLQKQKTIIDGHFIDTKQ